MKSPARKLVPIPTGAVSPFEPRARNLTYFIERTAGGAVSTLGTTLASVMAHLEVFEMGHTNLWIHRRVVLLTAHARPIHFADSSIRPVRADQRVGRFIILYETGSGVQWVPDPDSTTSPAQLVCGFATAEAAVEYAETNPQPAGNTLITQLVEDIFWH